ncbi:AAA family ATPase [Pedobacter sp. BMA]|uniref:AAA family ATPase n=1 Tax=Pedobacter sp. BMA TaxID=1663685 RepID=UPI00069D08F5|nr:AAA family ATPase [Pedobacter sp. BMA]
MIELDPNTPNELKGPIKQLYKTLFDPSKRLGALPGLRKIQDQGLQRPDNFRKLALQYKDQTHNLEIFHYVRENGNCLAISNPGAGNLIQLVLERFSRADRGTLELFHDGSITGTQGSNRRKNLSDIRQAQSRLDIAEDCKEINLGTLPKTYTFEDEAFTRFLSNFIIYALERKTIKNMLNDQYPEKTGDKTLSPFKNFIERLIPHVEQSRPQQYFFNREVYTDHHIWVSDYGKSLNEEPAHYEIILRDVDVPLKETDRPQICIDIHFEKRKKDSRSLIESLSPLPEKIKEIPWHHGNSLSYTESYGLDDPDLLEKVTAALDYFRRHIQHPLIDAVNILYQKFLVNKLLVNLTWNSNDWKSPSEDKSNHDWVKNGGTPMESWNFDKQAEWNTPALIFGNATFTKRPKLSGRAVLVFHSQNKIVGFYGDAALIDKKIGENEKNLQGSKALSFVLENKIPAAKESGYLEDKQRIGQIGFNYIQHDQTLIDILDKALELNTAQSGEILDLKNWFQKNITPAKSGPTIMKHPKNQILFGPPGTGKTYRTINRSLKIIGGKEVRELNWNDRAAVKKLYDAKVKSGQIVFTTFHQSMGYEDFIEGIKPQEPASEGGPVTYSVEPGIFKAICQKAAKPLELQGAGPIDFQKAAFFKMSLGGKDRPDIHEYCLSHDLIALGHGSDEDFTALSKIKDWKTFRDAFKENHGGLAGKSKYNIQAVFIFQRMKIGDIVIISKGNHLIDAVGRITGEYFYEEQSQIGYHQFRNVQWLAKNINQTPEDFFGKKISQQSIYELEDGEVRPGIKAFFDQEPQEQMNYVIIIDEINRGNVSAIFGELITCIEDSKRLGQTEALKVTLPYSKEEFGVPGNVYLIGTMNTADRSVEALDTALRRRFSFSEMLPVDDHELINSVAGIDLKAMLRRINLRLEKLVSRDHTIGHAFFLNLEGPEALYATFYDKVIPLLQEYFFGDYGKIGLVLGSDFIQEEKAGSEGEALFAAFEYEDKDLLMQKKVYRINKFEKDMENFLNAVRKI